MMEIDLHPAQAEMLRALLFQPTARFRDLNGTGLTNDHFTFHLKRLVEVGLVDKSAEGRYGLSVKGKEFANRMDTESGKIERQAKTAVLIVCVRKSKGKIEYLMQQRLKQPFYGYYGSISGKIRWGELVEEAGKRELLEETGLKGEMRLAGIEHKVDYDKEGNLLEDKFFYVMRVDNPEGELIEKFEGGKNIWIPADEILKLPKAFGDVKDVLEMVEKRGMQFVEKRFAVKEY